MAAAEAAARSADRLGGRAVGRWMLVRLARLPPDATALARALAVLETAETAQAGALAGLGPAAAGAAADALAAVGIVGGRRPLAFAHPMMREALYAELSPAERAQAHGESARLLHAAGAPPERVAEHLLSAEPAADPWAVERLAEAARAAAARGAPESAALLLRRALAEPPPEAQAFRLLVECGVAEATAGEPAGTRTWSGRSPRPATPGRARRRSPSPPRRPCCASNGRTRRWP